MELAYWATVVGFFATIEAQSGLVGAVPVAAATGATLAFGAGAGDALGVAATGATAGEAGAGVDETGVDAGAEAGVAAAGVVATGVCAAGEGEGVGDEVGCC